MQPFARLRREEKFACVLERTCESNTLSSLRSHGCQKKVAIRERRLGS